MKAGWRTIFLCLAIAFLLPSAVCAQEQSDSLVRLLEARSARLIQSNGQNLRKIIGPARFLHNNTYLLCDTALWNVDTRVIDAVGNVSIIQDGTVLTSDKMLYYSDLDLAEFRGSVVQLQDSDLNTLRTSHLDYNTKDSVAVFEGGGSMRDKDGQIIESLKGTYDSKIKTFTFVTDVNMFTDSIFVKTSYLKYESDINFATFGSGTDAWQEDNMLSAEAGWYDRSREVFFFRNKVHVMTDTQEGWSDSLYFYRATTDVEMLGNAQVTDTSRNVSAVAGRIKYMDSESMVTMTRKPAVISEIEDGEQRDTVYFGADTLIYRTIRYCDVDSLYIVNASRRLEEIAGDPISAYRKKSAEEAAKAAEEAAKNDPNYRPPQSSKTNSGKPKSQDSAPTDNHDADLAMQEKPVSKEQPEIPLRKPDTVAPAPEPLPSASDSLSAGPEAVVSETDSLVAGLDSPSAVADTAVAGPDSLAVGADSIASGVDSLASGLDSLAAGMDSLAIGTDTLALADTVAVEPLDTTKLGFLTALGNVKLYRKNMQVVCDSLEYSDVDSLARLFKGPVIWNEVTQQYSADSITVVIRGNAMEKANLMSEAFIHMQEDETHFDQIKSTEMIAYFEAGGGLKRFDALGGASGIFFLKEKDALATVNKKESKMLSADFVDGEIEKIRYYDEVKSDAYPVVQLTKDEQILKGFNWQPDRRPADRFAVTPLDLRPVERAKYSARPRAAFRQTDTYFPGYMSDIYVQIAVRDSLAKVREQQRRIEMQEQERIEALRRDSLALADSLHAVDSLGVRADSSGVASQDSLAMADSLSAADSIAMADSLLREMIPNPSVKMDRKALREKKAAERRAAREAKIKAREERWAEKDRLDAEKAAAKQARKDAKLRERKRKMLEAAEKQARKDAAVLERYLKALETREARKESKSADSKKKAGRKNVKNAGKSGIPPASEPDGSTVVEYESVL